MLAIIALFREIFSQYFIITASIVATRISHTTIYNHQSHNINGNTNRKNGNVTVVGITHRNNNFLLETLLLSSHISSLISSFFWNDFTKRYRAIVSIITANNQIKGNFLIFSKSFVALDTIS